MRYLTFIFALTLVASCDRSQPSVALHYARPVYSPGTFRQSLTALIAAKDYASNT